MRVIILIFVCALALTKADNVELNENNCPLDFSQEKLLRHEEFCNKYYQCTYGKPVAKICPPNLVFDSENEICTWPKFVNCGDLGICICEDQSNGNGDCEDIGTEDNGNGNGDDGDNNTNGGGHDDPSQANEICGSEGSDGTLITNECCNKFYKCFSGQPVAMFCPANLNWNSALEQCDWPENVDCGDRTICKNESDGNGSENEPETDNGDGGGDCEDNGPGDGGADNGNGGGNGDPSQANEICGSEGSDGTLITNECCNKFYKCFNGEPVPMFCPAKLNWNIALEQCDWPENVDCGDRTICEDESDGDDCGDNEPETDNGNGGGNGDNNGSCNCSPDEAWGICANKGSDSILVANEYCNKYYICFNGDPVAMCCPGNLLYNPYSEQCDWPENVECGDRLLPDGNSGCQTTEDNGNGGGGCGDAGAGDNGNGNGDNGDNNTNGGGHDDPSQANEICGSEGSDGTLITNECCNKFYKCFSGKPVSMFCPANLNWNSALEQCDWPENVDCGDRTICKNESDGDGSENEPETDNGNGGGGCEDNGPGNGGADNGNGGGNGDPSQANEICGSEGSDGTLITNECCNKFYKCFSGQPVAMFCPANLNWNSALEQCDWPENVDCGDRTICKNESDGNGSENEPETDNGNGGGGCEDNGPGNGGADNGNGGGNGDPSQANEICGNEGSDGTLITNECCNKFYKCFNSQPVAMFCPVNLNWNIALGQCDWPQNVDCGDRTICEKESDGSEDIDNGDNAPESDTGNGSACNCRPRDAPVICAADNSENVLVAHEKCNKFYVCASGNPVAMDCPNNLLYNPYTERCDWPENVKCGDRTTDEDEDDVGEGDGEDCGNKPGDNGDNTDEDEDDVGEGDGEDCGNNGNSDPSEVFIICSAPDSDGVLIAHNKCNKFYKCFNGLPWTFDCPENLYWSTTTNRCDWKYEVDCRDRQ